MARSKLEQALDTALEELFPDDVILQDTPIKVGKRTLFVDRILPERQLAIEIDGRQHSVYVERFHKDAAGFKDSKDRDHQKELWLDANGFAFVRLKHNDKITAANLRKKILN